MGAKGAVSILYRGEKDVAHIEQDYMDKFGNPFPAAVRGMRNNYFIKSSFVFTKSILGCSFSSTFSTLLFNAFSQVFPDTIIPLSSWSLLTPSTCNSIILLP